mmetsp:Transcript_39247/g.43891  ORF Transcript_39247/g.43891 Transcript_39247/m.43891 type:complete len:220 (+) Transcript_39247:372-1031(+)
MNSTMQIKLTLSSKPSKPGYMDSRRTTLIIMITILLTHPIVPSTNLLNLNLRSRTHLCTNSMPTSYSNYLINSLLRMIMTSVTHLNNGGSNQCFEKDSTPTRKIMTTTLSLYLIILSNQVNRKHLPRHVVRGVHPSSSAARTEYYFVSLVLMILRRYWTRHALILKIFCFRKANFVQDAFFRCLHYSHRTHENKLYYRDRGHLNLSRLYIDCIVALAEY